MPEDYLTPEQMAAQCQAILQGAATLAVGTATTVAGIAGAPAIALTAGLGELLASFGVISGIAGGLTLGGAGLTTLAGGTPLSAGQATVIAGVANPIGAAAAGLAAVTGDQGNVEHAVTLVERTFQLVELGNVFSSLPQAPEVLGPAFNLVVKPFGDMLMENLEEDLNGKDQRPLDISVSPVLNNSEDPVIAPGKAVGDAANPIDNASAPSNDTSVDQGGAADSGTDESQ